MKTNNTHSEESIPCYLLDPHDGVVKLRVYGLQVFERRLLVQHSLVERQREAGIDELAVVQSLRGELHKKKKNTIRTQPSLHLMIQQSPWVEEN